MTVQKTSKIYIAGHRGMVGSTILRRLQSAGQIKLVTRTRQELDLLDLRATFDTLQTEKSDYTLMAAAMSWGCPRQQHLPS